MGLLINISNSWIKISESQTGTGDQEFQSLNVIENFENDPWDMMNNFRFHVYAQKSLFVGESANAFLPPPPHPILLV